MKYEIHFRQGIDTHYHYSLIGQAETLHEARELRKASGDLVVFSSSKEIVCNYEWLFEWEKEQNSYAKRAIEYQEELDARKNLERKT